MSVVLFGQLHERLADLPAAKAADAVVASVLGGKATVLAASTGSGKTLAVSSLLAQKVAEQDPNGQVIVCVPRRSLATNAAETIAELSGLEIGAEVGFAVGKQAGEESKHGKDTKLLFVTYGYAISSGLIERAENIVFDEVHEASMDMSICRALVHRRMENGGKVNLLEMSATINAQKQAGYWGQVTESQVFEIEGKAHACERRHLPAARSHEAAIALLEEGRNGVLIFAPGVEDVKENARLAAELAEKQGLDIEVATIFGEMSAEERKKALAAPKDGKRKILVGTNVIESGMNIPWVDAGVTDGLGKEPVARESGAVMLDLVDLSRWRLEQQEGRVKRFKPGVFVLCAQKGFEGRPAETSPEITRLPLTELVMHCGRFGVKADELTFDYAPEPDAIKRAEVKLQRLGLVDDECKLTPAGRFTNGMPVAPSTGAMLWHAKQTGVLGGFLPLAAMVEAGGVRKDFREPHGLDDSSDAIDSLRAFEAIEDGLEAMYAGDKKPTKAEREALFEDKNVGFKRYNQARLLKRELKGRFNGEASKTMEIAEDQMRQCLLAGKIDEVYRVRRGYRGPEVATLDGASGYGVGNGTCVVADSEFMVGELRTIKPRNGGRPFTILQNCTAITQGDIDAVAQVRPEILTLHEEHVPDRWEATPGHDRTVIGLFTKENVIMDEKTPRKAPEPANDTDQLDVLDGLLGDEQAKDAGRA